MTSRKGELCLSGYFSALFFACLKTKKEHNLFETAFSLAKQKDGETFKILDYLNGVPVKREKDDSPDIVFQCSKGKRKAHKICLNHWQNACGRSRSTTM